MGHMAYVHPSRPLLIMPARNWKGKELSPLSVGASPSTHNNYRVPLLVLVLVTLASFLLLCAPNGNQARTHKASHNISSRAAHNGTQRGTNHFTTSSSALQAASTEKASLDNAADNDGTDDGIVDTLVGLGIVLLSVPLVGGGLLLGLSEPVKLFSVWCVVLERPG